MTTRLRLSLAGWLLPAVLCAQIPQPVIPESVGVNIHFVTGHERDLDLIAAGGFKFIRMDFGWEATERPAGQYNWSQYDELTAQLRKRRLRPIYILDYVHSAYEPKVMSHGALEPHLPEMHTASPRHPESIAAFAKWSAAAAKHFHKKGVIWEIYNEPNGDFWKPKPNADEYAALALATAKAIRAAEPSATIIAPAMAGFNWEFIETFLKSGVLQYIDGVSVHPYRNKEKPPETAASDYTRLRHMIDKYAPPSRQGKIPIISGEWGYSSNTRGVSVDTQAEYAVRQQLSNLLNGIPLSIWYDWRNDGEDPDENEQNFGSVNFDLTPKPAYLALQTMTRELAGYQLRERLDLGNGKDFVLVFSRRHAPLKLAAWTEGEPHRAPVIVKLDHGKTKDVTLDLRRMPDYLELENTR